MRAREPYRQVLADANRHDGIGFAGPNKGFPEPILFRQGCRRPREG